MRGPTVGARGVHPAVGHGAIGDAPTLVVEGQPLAAASRPRDTRRVHLLTMLALAVILGGALAMRLADLEGARSNFPDLFDEGIRAEQLFLMANGFRPYRDVYAAQGPLLLDTLYPFYRLFGETLGAVRLGVGVLSMVGLVGAYLAARQVGGSVGGVLACALLALSPSYLEGSRLALAEVPSIAPALLALAAALRYGAGGSRGWLVGSALLFGAALLIKPMVVPAGVAIGLAIATRVTGVGHRVSGDAPSASAARYRSRFVDLAIFAAVVAALTAAVVLIMGPREVFEQVVAYRLDATGNSGWSARESWKEAIQGPIAGHPSLYALAMGGAALVLARAPRHGAGLVAWPLATFGLLFLYTPLHPKHLVYLAPPAAVLGGAGLGIAWRLIAGDDRRPATETGRSPVADRRPPAAGRAGLAAAVALLLAWDVATVQPALARGVRIELDADDQDLHVFDDQAARTLGALVPAGEFLLTDHPYIAFLARRMVPPELVDPSRGRARAGTLTEEVAARSATERDTRVVLFWADRLRRLGRFNQWVEQRYRPVASFGTRVARSRNGKDRTVYLRNDADFGSARAALAGLLERPLSVDFDGDLRLLGVTVDRSEVGRGQPFSVTMGWEAIRDVGNNYNLILSMLGPDGQAYAAQEQDLEGTGTGTNGWGAGRWIFRSFMLLPETSAPPGEYRVVVGLDNTRARRPAGLTGNPDSLTVPAEAPGRVVVGTVRVR